MAGFGSGRRAGKSESSGSIDPGAGRHHDAARHAGSSNPISGSGQVGALHAYEFMRGFGRTHDLVKGMTMSHDILKRLGLEHIDVRSPDFLEALNRMQEEARESLKSARRDPISAGPSSNDDAPPVGFDWIEPLDDL